MHCWLCKEMHFVWLEVLTMLVDDPINIFLIKKNMLSTFECLICQIYQQNCSRLKNCTISFL